MIGQKFLIEQFDKFDIQTLPKSVLLVGAVGSGRKTFVREIADRLNVDLIEIGQSADDVRELSKLCNHQTDSTIYLVPNVEQMSAAAQNSLLKILEEPPNDAHFMLTAVQENMILSTIHSRCMTYQMSPYSSDELMQYLLLTYPTKGQDDVVIGAMTDACNCPGDIDLLLSQDVRAFLDYVQLTYKNIAKVSGANSFKIGSKINLADDDKKFDLRLFWRTFTAVCLRLDGKDVDENRKKMLGASITAKYYADLQIKGLNKSMLFDNWILDIRKAWM